MKDFICPHCKSKVSSFHQKSHIVPEWMHKHVYDNDHRAIGIKMNHDFELIYKGHRGSFICKECEDVFAIDDRNGSIILRKTESLHIDYHEVILDGYNRRFEAWRGIPYFKLRDFVFSILLRQHYYLASKGKRFTTEKHLNGINKIYRSENPDDLSYPIIINKVSDRSILAQPFIKKVDGQFIVEFIADGFLFQIVTSSHKHSQSSLSYRLKNDGTAIMLEFDMMQVGSFRASLPKFGELNLQKGYKIEKWFTKKNS